MAVCLVLQDALGRRGVQFKGQQSVKGQSVRSMKRKNSVVNKKQGKQVGCIWSHAMNSAAYC